MATVTRIGGSGSGSSVKIAVVRLADTPKTVSTGRVWRNGQKVELRGTIWPSKGGAKYYIKGDEGNSAHLKSDAMAKLKVGTRVWVKGVVEYVHVPRPKDYHNDQGGVNYGVRLPQTFCYINVSKFKVIEKTP